MGVEFINRKNVENAISDLIKEHGFQVRSEGDDLPQVVDIKPFSKAANILISRQPIKRDNIKNGEYYYRVVAQTSISSMGGEPTVEELENSIDEITRKKDLMRAINEADLEFVVVYTYE